MGLSQEEIEGAVRFSFSCMNTGEEIEETLKKLKDAVKKNRQMLSLAGKAERIADNGNAAGSGGKPAGTGVKNEIEMRDGKAELWIKRENTFIVRCGEVALKGMNKPYFERVLWNAYGKI